MDSLTASLIAWKQFECGINEFKEALGKDTGALKRLTGALESGSDASTNNLAHDVKEVAKILSEKIDNPISSGASLTSANGTEQQVNTNILFVNI